ncbi:CDP-glucose 4,6-dehydratase [Rhodocyclus tenuis]|uniref:CDP-glucose 4,6-dehydratase n=1 Tax=Rhodocyclus gracilis TaxID=2929842 RepID=A0ABX0WK81_9RHOO|nr:CDP-glucose 4,6-dehydratase [Rhodocyclus gracilis]NJA89182.1 CDP-glucose 4,6-dehydratase [Rhodocyclus gracilis]
MVNPEFWRGKRVFLTGHTGFKGGWLSIWLHRLGAEVTGFALPPPTAPSLFASAGVEGLLHSTLGDIRDAEALTAALTAADPDIVFHLAAQPLVGDSYRDPVGTYATNVTGTLNLLQAARQAPRLGAVVVVTTDKCYENRETKTPYREGDALGGHDPYSSSKACAEILTHAWRRSFFHTEGAARIASARAGNVIGGGDWAEHRLVPDLLRAYAAGETARLRHPGSIRPWQHVLEPLSGYLTLAERLYDNRIDERAWNFGPPLADCISVGDIADLLASYWPTPAAWQVVPSELPHEAGVLMLDASLAQKKLQWRPRWPLSEALRRTAEWHLAWMEGQDMYAISTGQIDAYAQRPDSL